MTDEFDRWLESRLEAEIPAPASIHAIPASARYRTVSQTGTGWRVALGAAPVVARLFVATAALALVATAGATVTGHPPIQLNQRGVQLFAPAISPAATHVPTPAGGASSSPAVRPGGRAEPRQSRPPAGTEKETPGGSENTPAQTRPSTPEPNDSTLPGENGPSSSPSARPEQESPSVSPSAEPEAGNSPQPGSSPTDH